MKIACLGNMNNMLFQIGRYLIDAKHDVTFFMFDEFDHFLPEADTYENIANYKIVNLGWNFESFLNTSVEEIRKLFNTFEVLIGTDLAPAFLFKAGLKLNYFFPHGSDIYEFPFCKYKNHPPQLWEIPFNLVSRHQKYGIKNADYVMMDDSDDSYEMPLLKIRGDKRKRICAPPFLYLNQYSDDYPKRSSFYEEFQKIRKKYELIVFQQIAQDWSSRGPFKIDKGNNHLINGFAKFLQQKPELRDRSILILMEYGGDVEKSKKLIHELGINNEVIWMKKMQRKDLMVLISIADICVGELGYRTWYSYSSIMEFMAMKKPLMHHRGDEHYKAKGLELYPMVDIKDASGVTDVLIDLSDNKHKYIQMGIEAGDWILKDNLRRLDAFSESLKNIKPNQKISNYWLKKLKLYLNLNQLYNLFFYFLYSVKRTVKN
jgi:hypothetical protein